MHPKKVGRSFAPIYFYFRGLCWPGIGKHISMSLTIRNARQAWRRLVRAYPEVKAQGILAAELGAFGPGKVTKKGDVSLAGTRTYVNALVIFGESQAEAIRTTIPQEILAFARDGPVNSSQEFRLDPRSSETERLEMLRAIQTVVRDRAGFYPSIRLELGGRPLTFFNLNDLAGLIAADAERYEVDEDDGRELGSDFKLIVTNRHVGLDAGREQRQGAFFPHYSNRLDLSRYGIYQNREEADYEDTCLIQAMITSGLDDVYIAAARTRVQTRDFPQRRLKALALQIGVDFQVHTLRSAAMQNRRVFEYSSGVEGAPLVRLALLEGHYFVYDERTQYTTYFAGNYDRVLALADERERPIEDFSGLTAITQGRRGLVGKTERARARPVDSWHLIRNLLRSEGAFTRIPVMDASDVGYTDLNKKRIAEGDYELEDQIPDECDLITFKNREKSVSEIRRVVYADFETATKNNAGKPLPAHVPYMVGFAVQEGANGEVGAARSFYSADPARLVGDWLDAIVEGVAPERDRSYSQSASILVYYHNLRYDWAAMVEHVMVEELIEKDHALYEVTIVHKGRRIAIRDSYKLIPAPLSAFGKMFNLDVEKDVMPYDHYTIERVRAGLPRVPIAGVRGLLPEDKRGAFAANVERLGMRGSFDPIAYASHYCEMDVKVLAGGIRTFRSQVREAFEMDVYAYRTISSLSYEYQVKEGCFEGCRTLSGANNLFVSRAVVGGQCQIANNEPHASDEPLVDFDMTSCYPSAQASIRGYPTGNAKVIRDVEAFDLGDDRPYYVEIELLDAHYVDTAHHDFPAFCEKTDGISNWTDRPGQRRYVVNNTMLSDIIRHYGSIRGTHYRVLRGLVFEGWNPRINEVITAMFERRRELKRQRNPLQQVYKLMLNSSYGKLIVKPSATTLRIFRRDAEPKIASFIANNYSRISRRIDTGKQSMFVVHSSLSTHRSSPQAGAFVLAQAKWLMRSVFLHAREKDVRIHYTDTDSMILAQKDLPVLMERFGGDGDLGTFHTDLESGPLSKIKGGPLYSSASVFHSKKVYHLLLTKRDEEGRLHYDETTHARCKGIPTGALEYEAEQRGLSVRDLYTRALAGETFEVDLLMGGERPAFRYNDQMAVRSIDKFTRTLAAARNV